MRRLRSTDGTPVHRRTARYHHAQCLLGTAPLHKTLADEIGTRAAALIAKARATEDLADISVAADAAVDAAELAFENTIREIDADLARMDRQNPALGAQLAVFPTGYGAEIDPEGDAQLAILPALRVRLAPFKDNPLLAPTLTTLDTAEATLKAALTSLTAAEAAVDTSFAEEVAARTAIREQLESAYGRLRDFYKSRPTLAEAFFLKEGSTRRPAKKEAAGPAPATGAPGTPAPATPATPVPV